MRRAEPYALLAADYDRELGEPAFETFHRPFLEALLRQSTWRGVEALDLACGTGLVTCYLSSRGLRAVGLDRSRAMLERARQRPGSGRVAWVCGDARRFAFARRFGLITCTFDSVNHLLSVRDVQQLFRMVGRHLSDTGVFAFDVNTEFALANHWSGLSRVLEGRERSAVWLARWDAARGRAVLIADYLLPAAGGRHELHREVHRERAYDDASLRRWLAAAGLAARSTRADDLWEAPGPGTRRVGYVCTLVDRGSATPCPQ